MSQNTKLRLLHSSRVCELNRIKILITDLMICRIQLFFLQCLCGETYCCFNVYWFFSCCLKKLSFFFTDDQS